MHAQLLRCLALFIAECLVPSLEIESAALELCRGRLAWPAMWTYKVPSTPRTRVFWDLHLASDVPIHPPAIQTTV
eukprot:1472885-Prymnesium_polylepis.1